MENLDKGKNYGERSELFYYEEIDVLPDHSSTLFSRKPLTMRLKTTGCHCFSLSLLAKVLISSLQSR